jgi:hypothetical protein
MAISPRLATRIFWKSATGQAPLFAVAAIYEDFATGVNSGELGGR